MTPILVIGYGNTLRRDDGAGAAVASRFVGISNVRVLTPHQLVPELAEDLAASECVVFIDAAANAEADVAWSRLIPSNSETALGHAANPEWLLSLTFALHGRLPEAWLLAIRGVDFGYGEELSPSVRERAEQAVERLRQFIAERGS